MIHENITKRRTIRKFSKREVSKEALQKCVDGARLSPSGMNRQPLKYVIINESKLLEEVFSTTNWAGYIPDYYPTKGEMPRAYIIVLLDKSIRKNCGHDCGISAMSISMIAYEQGLGSCILGAIDRSKLRKILNVPEQFDIVLAIALGYPAEDPTIDEIKNGDIKYWLDKKGTLHVPKRKLKDIIFWNKHH